MVEIMLMQEQCYMSDSNSSQVFLMAEDNPIDAELYADMLKKAFNNHYSVVCVDRFDKIGQALEQGNFQALILDMELPDQSGISNVHQIGQKYPALPIVVLTGNEDLEMAIDSLQSGAQDYLSKNKVTPEMLARSLHYAKERKQIERKLKDALDDAAYKNVQLEAQAKYDHLTGIANRSYFHDVAKRMLMRAQRSKLTTSLMYLDLNEFKKVNDTFGHMAGDELLVAVAKRLQAVVRDSDFLARMSGDEFVIITDALEKKRDAYPLVRRVQRQFDQPFHISNHHVNVSASMGVAFYPDADNLDLLIKQADCAMYEAKSSANATACFYSQKIAEQYARAQKVESLLGHAIENKEVITLFQPVINVRDADEIHVEALVRWHSSDLGDVAPNEFIPIAENTPVINEITQAITYASSRFNHSSNSQRLDIGRISINISAHQITNKNFPSLFLSWLDQVKLPYDKVCLELTERQVVDNLEQCRTQLNSLRRKGIQVALDDFGSGFSSITHLLALPFDVLKLDRLLMDRIDENERNQALVAGIIEMAHRLEMSVVAEGIERDEERGKAISLGCDYLQGFLISRPVNAHDALSYFATRH